MVVYVEVVVANPEWVVKLTGDLLQFSGHVRNEVQTSQQLPFELGNELLLAFTVWQA